MDLNWILLAVFGGGGGMFLLGWVARGLAEGGTRAEAPPEPALPMRRWSCPSCGRSQALPANLGYKVMLCNRCNVRLVAAD